jgi:glycosyltransferase involved in cell wall biosynthesis
VAETPEITVIIPAYNAERTVGIAVDSVLAQTFADFELLVIDDGSQDETADVVTARDDRRVRCVRTENGGVSVARNRGLELAAGSYVAFLDADDAWQPTKLERQHLALTENPHVGLSFASAHFVDDDLRPVGLHVAVVRPDYSEALLLEGNILAGSASSVMVRTSVMKQVGGFDPSLSLCADWDLWLRTSVVTKFVPVHETLVLYRRLPGTMSSDPKVLERDTFALLDKFYADGASAAYSGLRKRAYANQWMVCAGSYLHTGHLRDSLRCVAAGLRSDPRTVRRLLARGDQGYALGIRPNRRS